MAIANCPHRRSPCWQHAARRSGPDRAWPEHSPPPRSIGTDTETGRPCVGRVNVAAKILPLCPDLCMVGWLRGLLGVFLAGTRLSKRLRAGFVLAAPGVAAVSLAACGRAGPPEPPPGPIFDSSYSPPGAARALAPAPAPPGSPKICARGNTKTLHKTALIRAAIRSRGRVSEQVVLPRFPAAIAVGAYLG